MSDDIYNKTTFFEAKENNVSAYMHLTVFDGTSEPMEINLSALGKGMVTFGRDAQNDIVIKSKYVSRRHGMFRLLDGAWQIQDMQRVNGLILNDKFIQSKILEDGDSIRIDDRVEAPANGVLLVFSKENYVKWNNFNISNMSKPEITIGRGGDCDILLDHISVSKFHATIVKRNNDFYLVDNNSTNGVTVNGREVTGRVRLNEKDFILITNSKIIFTREKISYYCFKRGISVEAFKIVKKVGKGKTICNEVDINIQPGEMVAIVGGSGAGKTTLMNCLCGYDQPTYGQVVVNGIDLYEYFSTIKNIIGYVPQSDIVYDNLTVYDMLNYTAWLRLPNDITKNERLNRISNVIDTVELAERKDTLIKNLSGGQRKRTSIAVELLADPNLLFLDEPASGLDPGTERNLVKTLKGMTSAGKTVIFVTHSTLNLYLCDKIAFMGTGGYLCFYGSYGEALRFFGVDDVVDVYNLITYESKKWHDLYVSGIRSAPQGKGLASAAMKSYKRNLLEQLPVLFKRNMHLILNDKIRLMLIILQAPLLAFLISFVTNGDQFDDYRITKSLLFALSCSAFWIGILNSIQEVCKERNVLKREYMTCLRLDAYILSKILVIAVVCAIQSFLLVSVFVFFVGMPDEGVMTSPMFEFMMIAFLTSLSASAMGLFVSSLFKNADRAMTVAPLLLMPQLLFSGLIFELSGVSKSISYFAVCRWSMEGLGTTANLNTLDTITKEGLRVPNKFEAFFEFTASHQVTTWIILVVFVFVFSTAAGAVLRNINKSNL